MTCLPHFLLPTGVLALALGWSAPASSDVCQPVAVAVDTSLADTGVLSWGCRGYGQVFLAADTLVQSISIWRLAHIALDGIPRYLFLLGTDSLGRPDADQLLLDAGPLVRQAGDGIHPVEYRWVFDPPFSLPRRGKFCLVAMASYLSNFDIPAAATNPYPDGEAWEMTAVWNCSQPGPPYGDTPPEIDLVFEVRFCASGATPALPQSWGHLKVIYR